jgi:hypothetical protein
LAITVYAPAEIFWGTIKVPLNVTLESVEFTGTSTLVSDVDNELPFGPYKLTIVTTFLIPLGCETINSNATTVFAEINSTVFGVNVNDSTTGRTLALAIFELRLNARNKIINDDFIFMFYTP